MKNKTLSENDIEDLIDKYFSKIKAYHYMWDDECKYIIRKIEQKAVENYICNEKFRLKCKGNIDE